MALPGQSANYSGDPVVFECMVIGPAPTDNSDEIQVHRCNGLPFPGQGPSMRLMGWLLNRKDQVRVGTITQDPNTHRNIPHDGDIVMVRLWGHAGTNNEFTPEWWWLE